jgi:hypothetical protein
MFDNKHNNRYGSMILFEIALHHNQKGCLIKVRYCNGHVEIDRRGVLYSAKNSHEVITKTQRTCQNNLVCVNLRQISFFAFNQKIKI